MWEGEGPSWAYKGQRKGCLRSLLGGRAIAVNFCWTVTGSVVAASLDRRPGVRHANGGEMELDY